MDEPIWGALVEGTLDEPLGCPNVGNMCYILIPDERLVEALKKRGIVLPAFGKDASVAAAVTYLVGFWNGLVLQLRDHEALVVFSDNRLVSQKALRDLDSQPPPCRYYVFRFTLWTHWLASTLNKSIRALPSTP